MIYLARLFPYLMKWFIRNNFRTDVSHFLLIRKFRQDYSFIDYDTLSSVRHTAVQNIWENWMINPLNVTKCASCFCCLSRVTRNFELVIVLMRLTCRWKTVAIFHLQAYIIELTKKRKFNDIGGTFNRSIHSVAWEKFS